MSEDAHDSNDESAPAEKLGRFPIQNGTFPEPVRRDMHRFKRRGTNRMIAKIEAARLAAALPAAPQPLADEAREPQCIGTLENPLATEALSLIWKSGSEWPPIDGDSVIFIDRDADMRFPFCFRIFPVTPFDLGIDIDQDAVPAEMIGVLRQMVAAFQTERPRPNAQVGDTVTIQGIVFTFTTDPLAAGKPFTVLIGADAAETDRRLHEAIEAAGAYLPPGAAGCLTGCGCDTEGPAVPAAETGALLGEKSPLDGVVATMPGGALLGHTGGDIPADGPRPLVGEAGAETIIAKTEEAAPLLFTRADDQIILAGSVVASFDCNGTLRMKPGAGPLRPEVDAWLRAEASKYDAPEETPEDATQETTTTETDESA